MRRNILETIERRALDLADECQHFGPVVFSPMVARKPKRLTTTAGSGAYESTSLTSHTLADEALWTL